MRREPWARRMGLPRLGASAKGQVEGGEAKADRHRWACCGPATGRGKRQWERLMARSLAGVGAKEGERERAEGGRKEERRGERGSKRGATGDAGWIPAVLAWTLEQRRPKLKFEPSNKEPSFQCDREWSQQYTVQYLCKCAPAMRDMRQIHDMNQQDQMHPHNKCTLHYSNASTQQLHSSPIDPHSND